MLDPKIKGVQGANRTPDAPTVATAKPKLATGLGPTAHFIDDAKQLLGSWLKTAVRRPLTIAMAAMFLCMPVAQAGSLAGTHGAHPPGIELAEMTQDPLVVRHRAALKNIEAKRDRLYEAMRARSNPAFDLSQSKYALEHRMTYPESEREDRYGPIEVQQAGLQAAQVAYDAATAVVAERQADVDAALAPLADAIAEAKVSLAAIGIDAIVLSMSGAEEDVLPILDVARAWSSATGQDVQALPRSELAVLVLNARNRTAGTDTLLANIDQLPVWSIASPWTLSALDNEVPQLGVDRATTLHAAGAPATALDFGLLAELSPERFDALVAFIKDVQTKTGFDGQFRLHKGNFDIETELEVLADLSRVALPDREISVFVFHPANLRSVKITLDAAQLFAGIEAMESFGIPFSGKSVEVAALLGNGAPEMKARLTKLLERAEVTGLANEAEMLAELAARGGNFVDEHFDAADEVADRLGRKLTTGELRAVLLGGHRGTSADALVDADAMAAAIAMDGRVPVKDLQTWKMLDTDARTQSRSNLITSIRQRLAEGTPRSDRAAEYSEKFSDHASTLSTGELHKIDMILGLLGQTGVRQQLGDMIARDVQNEDSELGGWLSFDDEGRPRFEEVDGPGGNNNAYAFPFAADPHLAMAMFHLHATRDGGHAPSAGPSSSFDARTGDRAGAYAADQDGVIITFVEPGKFNVDFYTAQGAVVDLGNFSY